MPLFQQVASPTKANYNYLEYPFFISIYIASHVFGICSIVVWVRLESSPSCPFCQKWCKWKKGLHLRFRKKPWSSSQVSKSHVDCRNFMLLCWDWCRIHVLQQRAAEGTSNRDCFGPLTLHSTKDVLGTPRVCICTWNWFECLELASGFRASGMSWKGFPPVVDAIKLQQCCNMQQPALHKNQW